MRERARIARDGEVRPPRVTGVMSGQPLLHLAITTRLKLLWTFDKCWEIAQSWYFMMLIKCLRY